MKNVPEILKQLLIRILKIPNPVYLEASSAGRSTWGIPSFITNFIILPDDSMLIPRGLHKWLIERCKELKIIYNIVDNRTKFEHINVDSSKIRLRPYQYEAMVKLTSDSTEGVLVAPAGSGKTVIGLSLIPLVGQPTLWLTHTGPLADQAKERAKEFLPNIGKIGLIGRGKWEKGDILTIAMIQTLVRNIDELIKFRNEFGLAILDEAHHCPARTFLDVICQLNTFYLYALTATPYRRDKLETLMFQALGTETTKITIDDVELYGGIVVPTVKIKTIRSPNKVEGNNIQSILKHHIVNNNLRNNVIVNDVLKEASAGRFCIVISDRKKHCEILYKKISEVWKKTGIVTGKYNKKHIQEQITNFNEKRITVLIATFSLLGEGFDVPFLDRAFISMPFRSEAKAEQLIGRIQRTYPGKKDAVVYDYVDIDIGVVRNQFDSNYKDCRSKTYKRLGVKIES